MKRLSILALSVMLALGLVSQVSAQRYQVEIQQQVIDTNLAIDVYVKLVSGVPFAMGATNFSLYLSEDNLDVLDAKLDPNFNGPWSGTANYSSLVVATGTDPAFFGGRQYIVLNILSSGSGATPSTAPMVTSTPTRVGRVLVPITDHSGFNTATWRYAPLAFNDWMQQIDKTDGIWQDPAPNFPLCRIPDAPSLSASAKTLCPGDDALLTSDATGVHTWYQDGVQVPGVAGNSLQVEQPGFYSAVVNEFSCQSPLSGVLQVEVLDAPEKPNLVLNNETLTTDADGNFQWLLNGEPIAASNGPDFEPQESGLYSVRVTNACGSIDSDPVEYEKTISLQEGGAAAVAFGVTPNPYDRQTTISYRLPATVDVHLRAYDAVGRLVADLVDESQPAGEYTVAFGAEAYGWPKGVYTLKLEAGSASAVLNVVETN